MNSESFRRKADAAERRIHECKAKIAMREANQRGSGSGYEHEHDWAMADMFFNDAAAITYSDDRGRMIRDLRREIETRRSLPHSEAFASEAVKARLGDLLTYFERDSPTPPASV